jgi:hypothetical protein
MSDFMIRLAAVRVTRLRCSRGHLLASMPYRADTGAGELVPGIMRKVMRRHFKSGCPDCDARELIQHDEPTPFESAAELAESEAASGFGRGPQHWYGVKL